MEENTVVQEIFRPFNRKSAVWAYFGLMKDANGQLYGLPICNTCRSKIKAKGGNTTNLMNHLRDKHKQLYKQLKSKQNNSATPQEDYEPIRFQEELASGTALFRTKILSLMESLMVKTTSEIVSIFDEIYTGAEAELKQRRKEVAALTHRLKEREQLCTQDVCDNLPVLKVESEQQFLESALFHHGHSVPESTETVEFALECVVMKAEEPMNAEAMVQPPEYQLELNSAPDAPQQPLVRADEELLGAPVCPAEGTESQFPAVGQPHHQTDQDTTCSIATAEPSSSVATEDPTSPRQDRVVSGSPSKSNQAIPPIDQQHSQPAGMTMSISSSAQHTSSPLAPQTEDVNAMGFTRKHKIRVRLRDFPSWQEFKKQCLEISSASSPDAHSSSAPQEPLVRADEELMGAPVCPAEGAESQFPAAGQPHHQTDQDTTCSTTTAEPSSSVATEDSSSARQDWVASGTPESSEATPAAGRRRGRSAGLSPESLSAPGTTLHLRSRSAVPNTRTHETLDELDNSPCMDAPGTNGLLSPKAENPSVVTTEEETTSHSASSESETENLSDVEVKYTAVKRKKANSKASVKPGDTYQRGKQDTSLKRGSAGKSEKIPRKKRRMTDPECKHDVNGALYPFEKILQRRTAADGQEEVRVKWWPCSSCGAKWRNSWEPA